MEEQTESSTNERIWEQGWDGHEQAQQERLAKLSLADKLTWLEEAHRLVRHLQAGQGSTHKTASDDE